MLEFFFTSFFTFRKISRKNLVKFDDTRRQRKLSSEVVARGQSLTISGWNRKHNELAFRPPAKLTSIDLKRFDQTFVVREIRHGPINYVWLSDLVKPLINTFFSKIYKFVIG